MCKEMNIFSLERTVDKINTQGLLINQEALSRHYAEQEKIKREAEERIYKIFPKDISLNSYPKVSDYFFNVLGFKPLSFSGKTNKPSLDKETLEHYAQHSGLAQALLTYREAKSAISMLTNIDKAIVDGRIYPRLNINGTVSGRFTSSTGKAGNSVNMQNIKKEFRDIVKAEGTMVTYDYKNMEYIVSACVAKQFDVIEEFKKGKDAHTQLAEQLGVPRATAKTLNLAINYGMSPFGVSKRIGTTEEEAKIIIKKYWDLKPNVLNYKKRIIARARELGFLKTWYGLAVHARGISDEQIWATFIQGTAADLLKLALVSIDKYLTETNTGKIIMTVHDSITIDINPNISEEEKETTIANVHNIMCNVDTDFTLFADIKINEW